MVEMKPLSLQVAEWAWQALGNFSFPLLHI